MAVENYLHSSSGVQEVVSGTVRVSARADLISGGADVTS
jgi:hypothetical protein